LASHRPPSPQLTFLFLEENAMSNPARTYEPLTSDNAALVLIDHQVGLMTGVRDYSIAELKHNVLGLANAAKALQLPIVVTTTARDSMWGPTFPELIEALPGAQIIDRASVNAFDDPRVAGAIEATRRRKLILRVSRWRSVLRFLPSRPSIRASTDTSLWMPAAHLVQPNVRRGCYG
jgi:nicotinamidase-related amidase